MTNTRVLSIEYDGLQNLLPKRIQYLQKFVPNYGWGERGYWETIDVEIVPAWAIAELTTTGLTTWESKWINVKGVDWKPKGKRKSSYELLNDAIRKGFITKASLNY